MTAKVRTLCEAIKALADEERQELAQEILPLLLATRAGVAEIDHALAEVSDDELDAIVERARRRAGDLADATVTAVIDEALRAVRSARRS